MSVIKVANKPGSTARKSVNVGKKPERVAYVPTAQDLSFEAKASKLIDKTFDSEPRINVKFTQQSLEDLLLLEEALVSMRASYRVTRYGRADGGKAKNLSAADAQVKKARIDQQLEKTRKAIRKFEKAVKA